MCDIQTDRSKVVNALTFDVEDWHQLVEWKLNGVLPACSPRVVSQTHYILGRLSTRDVRATFFVLGYVARAYPQLVRDIQSAGHEVGSHGWTHRLVYQQTPAEFAEEARRSKAVLEDILGERVLGYRAAEFSITAASRWALDILADLGYEYDSSIFPIRGSRYGILDVPLGPHQVTSPPGPPLVEIPLTAIDWAHRRWPIGGGGYFRVLPYAVTRSAISKINREGRVAIMYFHPYEFSQDVLVPRLSSARRYITGARYVFFHNMNRGANRRRFERLLADFRFSPLAEVMHHE